MATIFSHAIAAYAVGQVSKTRDTRALILGVFGSIIPDLDVIGFRYGVPYGALWGHRGVTHSLFFAAVLSGVLTAIYFRHVKRPVFLKMFLFLFVCTASHGVLDAMTNGGLGVAFFSPFVTTRYFFGFRPIVVSPIGYHRFVNGPATQVLISELKWIWVPCLALILLFRVLRGRSGYGAVRAGN